MNELLKQPLCEWIRLQTLLRVFDLQNELDQERDANTIWREKERLYQEAEMLYVALRHAYPRRMFDDVDEMMEPVYEELGQMLRDQQEESARTGVVLDPDAAISYVIMPAEEEEHDSDHGSDDEETDDGDATRELAGDLGRLVVEDKGRDEATLQRWKVKQEELARQAEKEAAQKAARAVTQLAEWKERQYATEERLRARGLINEHETMLHYWD